MDTIKHLPASVSTVCGNARVTYRPGKGFTVHGNSGDGAWFRMAWFADLGNLHQFNAELASEISPKASDLNTRRVAALAAMSAGVN